MSFFITSNWLDDLLTYITAQQSSDIHIEPCDNAYRIRIRHDGLLREYAELTMEQGEAIITRLKVLSHCDIAEKRLPQDGRLDYTPFQQWDFRLSTCPTIYGEKIVIRNLNTMQSTLTLQQLGMHDQQLDLFQKILAQPQGLILVTGPTGSGKTVTLYSALESLNRNDINITSIEDPVEIYLSGINQINVNPKAGLNFAKVLKAILRQDPDIIMVGEIRDYETAELALAAAQTGHLVLSTLHTNTTIDTITRLRQMGFEHYQIQNALLLVIAQRLVRRLCDHCKKLSDSQTHFYQHYITHYIAQGCSKCHKGYRGRTAVYEMLPLTDELKKILWQQNDIELKKYHQTIFTIQDHAYAKIIAGETSIEEAKRVLGLH